jgi:Phage integrase family
VPLGTARDRTRHSSLADRPHREGKLGYCSSPWKADCCADRPGKTPAALAVSGARVFPGAEGKMRSEETKLQQVLCRALARAGLVLGYQHVCRRKGCGHKEEVRDRVLRLCPRCRMKLWPKAIPRPMRFHDLRGTTATLLARNGVGLVIAQRILRHSDPRLTANIYSRMDIGDLQAGIDRMGIPHTAVTVHS